MKMDQQLLTTLEEHIASYKKGVQHEHVGTVIQVGDGIAKISGLSKVGASEMIDFGNGVLGYTMNLEEDFVGAVIMGDAAKVKEGDTVKALGRVLSVPV